MANPTGKGGFKPGQSGNPGGRPKVIADVKDLARSHTETAIATLVDVMTTEDQPAAARVAAANAILDRGYGKPSQDVKVTHKREPTDYSDAELVELAERLARSGADGEAAGAREADSVH